MKFGRLFGRLFGFVLTIELAFVGPVGAESCVVFPIELHYLSVARSDHEYYVVLGHFQLDESSPVVTVVPRPANYVYIGNEAGSYCTWSGSIVGDSLGRRNFVAPVEFAATLTYRYNDSRGECVVPQPVDFIVFHEVGKPEPAQLINHGSCENNVVYADEDIIQRILSCHRGDGCGGYE